MSELADALIRPMKPDDVADVVRITVESFTHVSIDQKVETTLGAVGGRSWKERKGRDVETDFANEPEGCFVAVIDATVVGYVTVSTDRFARKGRIHNLAVDAGGRGQGLGRRLIDRGTQYCREQGMDYLMIETLANNEVGRHLYPSYGFIEVAQQIHFAMRIEPEAPSSNPPMTKPSS